MSEKLQRSFWLVALLMLGFIFLGNGDPKPVSQAAKDAAKAAIEANKERRQEETKKAVRQVQSSTPIRPGCPPSQITPGKLKWWAKAAGGPMPYNCLEWSFCKSAAWAEPVPVGYPGLTAKTLKDLVTDEGFSYTPVDCKNNTSKHMIMLVWHVPTGEDYSDPTKIPPDGHWEHAMKRLDGKWSSKNGEIRKYEDIPDPDAFVKRHYPPRSGKKLVIRCFAKP